MLDPLEYKYRCVATPAPGVVCGVPARMIEPPPGCQPEPFCQHHEEEELAYRDGLTPSREVQ